MNSMALKELCITQCHSPIINMKRVPDPPFFELKMTPKKWREPSKDQLPNNRPKDRLGRDGSHCCE